MKKFTTALFVIAVCLMHAQTTTFQKIYDTNTVFTDIAPLSGGGYIACGGTPSGNHLLVKLSANGQTIWARQLGTLNWTELSYKVGEITGGEFYLLGLTNAFNINGFNDLNLIRFDASGNILWNKIYSTPGGDQFDFPSVRKDENGEFIISATYYDNSGGEYSVFIKTDNNGNLLWSTRFAEIAGTKMESYGLEISTTNTAYVAVGDATDAGLYAVCCSTAGNLLWSKKYYDLNNSFMPGYSIAGTIGGGYVILSCAGNNHTPMLIKIDGNGNFVWAKNYAGNVSFPQFGAVGSVQGTSDGGFIISGITNTGNYPLLIKTNSSGNFQWAKYYTLGYNYSNYLSVKQTPDNGFVLATTGYGNTNYGGWIIKTDPNGNTGCNETSVVFRDSVITLNTSIASVSAPGVIDSTVTFPIANIQVNTADSCTGVIIDAIRVFENKNSLAVFPNPSAGEFSIQTGNLKINAVEIFDTRGEKIYHSIPVAKNQSSALINISSQPKGVYSIKVTTNEGINYIRIILQ